MVFSSIIFLLCFLPVFLLVYALLPGRWKNPWLLVGSIIFYAWGAPSFIIIVLASILLDYYLVKGFATSGEKRKRLLAALAIGSNIALLIYFKYSNFFIDNLSEFLQALGYKSVKWVAIALPVGISFLTFQKITFIVDVYRGESKASSSVINYALYVLMFPQLIAGPIVRYHEIDEQLVQRNESNALRINGFYRFCFGLARKVLIADSLSTLADAAFSADPAGLDSYTAWLGLLAYTFQIYHDFAGYSDMAIGLGRMMGFELPENFRNPYISGSITEFWRRWHMSLGRFMRDYLYVPLGGNRKGNTRMYINLFSVFLISGLWHGAAWTFVIWGAWHGVMLVLERLFLLRLYKYTGTWVSMLITIFVAVNAWVLFRAEDLPHAMGYFKALYAGNVSSGLVHANPEHIFFIVFAALIALAAKLSRVEAWQDRALQRVSSPSSWKWQTLIGLIAFYLSLAAILGSGFHPFIYYKF